MTGPNPTDRGKKIGTKRHLLTEQNGVPLSVVITAANTHDMKATTTNTLDSIVIKRRLPSIKKHHLCLDKGYDFPEIQKASIERRFIPHIRHRGEEQMIKNIKHTTKRWVEEITNSWHNRFRKLLIRYEKKSANYLALVQLACCLILYRRIILG
jgi:putative transposase